MGKKWDRITDAGCLPGLNEVCKELGFPGGQCGQNPSWDDVTGRLTGRIQEVLIEQQVSNPERTIHLNGQHSYKVRGNGSLCVRASEESNTPAPYLLSLIWGSGLK